MDEFTSKRALFQSPRKDILLERRPRLTAVTGSEFVFDQNLPTIDIMESQAHKILLDRKYHPDAVSYSPIKRICESVVKSGNGLLDENSPRGSFYQSAADVVQNATFMEVEQSISSGNLNNENENVNPGNGSMLSSGSKEGSLRNINVNAPQSSWMARRNKSNIKSVPELKKPESHFIKKSFIFSGNNPRSEIVKQALPKSLGGSGILQQTEQRALSFRERMQRRK
jgi:hypothetical protein